MPKVGVVLSGCGVYDGAEIHESVCVLLALSQAGAEYQCMAPNAPQMHVVDHISGKPVTGVSRNVLHESARIARGEIVALNEVNVADYDAFIFPGGFGAAKNLCTFAFEGDECRVQHDVERIVTEAHAAGKPLAFVCIAPVIAAKVLGKAGGAKLTIGDDPDTAGAINAMGGTHVECPVTEAVVDPENKIVSTPAYMKAQSIAEVYEGVKLTVTELLKLIG
jgi:enhancing lycopene biosynthesis protein 2